jgi:hypothetical protein
MNNTKLSRSVVRLELLKLTYNNVHQPDEIIAKTKTLEAFVLEGEEDIKIPTAPESKPPVQSGSKRSKDKENEDKSLFT